MVETRRITESEAETVTALWDQMCQEPADGGSLRPQGWRNIVAQMRGSASHPEEFCLVAIQDERVVGFVKGLTTRQPLLPGVAGEIEALYVVPSARGQGTSAQLAIAAVDHLRAAGAGTIQTDVCIDDQAAHTFWEKAGFTADTVRFWLYAPAE